MSSGGGSWKSRIYRGRPRKESICGVARHAVPEGPESPQGSYSSVFARLASGAFYETIVSQTFYEFIIVDRFAKKSRADRDCALTWKRVQEVDLSRRAGG